MEILPDRAKLEALAEFAAGAGHEINNPLGTIAGRVQQLLRGERDPERRRALLTIGGQALRIRDMIGDVMLFARPPEPHPERVEVSASIRSVAAKFQEDAADRDCSLQTDVPDRLAVWADPVQLSVVLSELIRNSLNALDGIGGVVRIVAEPAPEQAGLVLISVVDNGPGFSDTEREHLFDPFFSGRQAGRGLGFGLSKCWRIVTNHGGRIEARSEPDGPTEFRVFWPAEAIDPAAAHDAAGPAA